MGNKLCQMLLLQNEVLHILVPSLINTEIVFIISPKILPNLCYCTTGHKIGMHFRKKWNFASLTNPNFDHLSKFLRFSDAYPTEEEADFVWKQ